MNEEMEKKIKEEITELSTQFRKELKEKIGQVSVDTLAQRYSNKTNDIIRKTESEKNCKYVGGQFVFQCVDGATFTMSTELYFKDAAKKWVQMKMQSDPVDMRELTEESAKELREKKKIAFEVEAPKEKTGLLHKFGLKKE